MQDVTMMPVRRMCYRTAAGPPLPIRKLGEADEEPRLVTVEGSHPVLAEGSGRHTANPISPHGLGGVTEFLSAGRQYFLEPGATVLTKNGQGCRHDNHATLISREASHHFR